MNLTQYEKDYRKFCLKCNLNDCDYGCTCRPNEEVYQCDMYRHYHPEEVKQFEKDMEEWQKRSEYQRQREKEFAIAELEKIKTEICKKHKIDCDLKCRECIYYSCLVSGASFITDIKILDKHIKKLKGE